MSSRFVTNVVQDRQGFIWIGTDYGINRFDGKDFKIFNAASHKLRVNSRSFLHLDVNGKLWINNDQLQVDILDPATETVTPLEQLAPELAGKSVQLLRNDRAGDVWGIVNNEYAFRYDGKLQYIAEPPPKELSRRFHIKFSTPWGTLFLADINGFKEFDIEAKQLNEYPMPAKSYCSAAHTDSSVLVGSFKALPSGLDYALQFWEIKQNKPPRLIEFTQNGQPYAFPVIQDRAAAIAANFDLQGRIWVVLTNHLMVFNKDGELLAENEIPSNFWQQFDAWSIFFDTQNQAWIRGKEGIVAVTLRQPAFRKLLQGEGIGFSVRGIIELNEKSILACTYSGIYQIDLQSGQHKKISPEVYFGALRATDNSVWLGSHARKVVRSKGVDLKFENINFSNDVEVPVEPLRVFEDSYSGKIYIGSRLQGLLVFNQKTAEIEPYPLLNEFEELAKLEVLYILPTKECLWLATSNGLFQMHREKGILAKFFQNYIYHLTIDDEGICWLATRGGGLTKWDRKNNTVKQFTTTDGLSHDIIYAAYDDGLGHLWLPSNYGLMQFDKRTGSVINYLPSEGISQEEFNNSSHLRGSDGSLYFGGLNGITAFQPAKITSQKHSAPLLVTALKVLNGNTLEDRLEALRSSGKIIIKPDEKFFTLQFAFLDFLVKKQVFAWKLEGLDKNWTVQTENNIRLNALPYGAFTLRIKAQGSGGHWAENELAIPVTVLRPFHQTWKFALLCALAFALSTYLFIRWRVKWLRREQQRLSALVEQRTKELIQKNAELESLNQTKDRLFGIIGHDLRSPLITLGGLARKVAFLIRQNRTDEVYELGESVENAVANVRNLLDNLLKWSIVQEGRFPHHPQLHEAAEIVEEVVGLYKQFAEAKGIQLVFQSVGDTTIFADRDSVSTIIRNLVDNAIKFTYEHGTVELTIERRGNGTFISVGDTGMGIPPAELSNIFSLKNKKGSTGTKGEKGNGLGLALCHDLAEINHGTIEAFNKTGGGALFVVKLPSSENQAISGH